MCKEMGALNSVSNALLTLAYIYTPGHQCALVVSFSSIQKKKKRQACTCVSRYYMRRHPQ